MRVEDAGLTVEGWRLRVQGLIVLGFRVQGLGVPGFEIRVTTLGIVGAVALVDQREEVRHPCDNYLDLVEGLGFRVWGSGLDCRV